MKETCEVDGRLFKAKRVPVTQGCEGCAADGDTSLCVDLPVCIDTIDADFGIIWLDVTETGDNVE